MNILILCVASPFPPIGGSSMRNYHLINALSKKHEVTLVSFDLSKETTLPTLRVTHIKVKWKNPPLYELMMNEDTRIITEAYEQLAFKVELPWVASYLESEEMKETLREFRKDQFDLVLIEEVQMGQFISELPPEIPKILDFHNVYSLMTERALTNLHRDENQKSKFEFERMLRFEKKISSLCAHFLVCSEKEALAAKRYLGISDVTIIPNGVDTNYFNPGALVTESGYLLFTGTMNYEPNIEGVKWFVAHVFPIVKKHIPHASFHVVGTNPSTEVLSLASDEIFIYGRVEDVRSFYHKADIVVVPLLSGGGTRLKILEAAASGKAIVTTTLGVEGQDFKHPEELFVVDDPTQFANAVIDLLMNHKKRKALEGNVRDPALKYSWELIGSNLDRAVGKVIG